jgi:hypothetical protein
MASKVSESALKTFLRRAVPYESMAAPMDSALRRASVVSLVVLFVASGGLFLMGDAPPRTEGNILLQWLYTPLRFMLSFLFDLRPMAFWANEAALIWSLAVAAATKGFREAGPFLNYLAMVPIVVAAADGLALGIIVALMVLIALMWIIITILIIAVILGALGAMLRGALGSR